MATKSSVLNRVRMFEAGSSKADSPAALSPAVSLSRRRLPSPSGSSFAGTESPSRKSEINSPSGRLRSPSVLSRYKYPVGDLSLTLSSPANHAVTSPGRLSSTRLEPFDSPQSRASPLQEQNTWKSGSYNQEMATNESKPFSNANSSEKIMPQNQQEIEVREDEGVVRVVSWPSPEDEGKVVEKDPLQKQRPSQAAHDENREPPPVRSDNTPTARLRARTNLAMRRRGTPTHSESPSKPTEDKSNTSFLPRNIEKIDDKGGHTRSRNLSVAQHLAKRKPQSLKEDKKKSQPLAASYSPGTTIRMEGLKRNLEDASVVMKEERASIASSTSSVRSSLSHEELRSVAKRALEISHKPTPDTRTHTSSLRQKIQYQQRANKKIFSKPLVSSPASKPLVSSPASRYSQAAPERSTSVLMTSSNKEASTDAASGIAQSQLERNFSRATKMTNALHRKRPFSPASPLLVPAEAKNESQSTNGDSRVAHSSSSPGVENKSKEEKNVELPVLEATKTSARIALLAAARRSKAPNPAQQKHRDIIGTASTEESDVAMNTDINLSFLKPVNSMKHLEINKTASTEGSDITTSSAVSRNSSRADRVNTLRVLKSSDQGASTARLHNSNAQEDHLESSIKPRVIKTTPSISRTAALQKLSIDPAMKRLPRSSRMNNVSASVHGLRAVPSNAMDKSSEVKRNQVLSPQRSTVSSPERVPAAVPYMPLEDEPTFMKIGPVIDEILPSKSDASTEVDDILASFRSFKAAKPEPTANTSNGFAASNDRKLTQSLRLSQPRKDSLKRTTSSHTATGPRSSFIDHRQDNKLSDMPDGKALGSSAQRNRVEKQRASIERKHVSASAVKHTASSSSHHPASAHTSNSHVHELKVIESGPLNETLINLTQMDVSSSNQLQESDRFINQVNQHNESPQPSAKKRNKRGLDTYHSPSSVKRRSDEATTLSIRRQFMDDESIASMNISMCQSMETDQPPHSATDYRCQPMDTAEVAPTNAGFYPSETEVVGVEPGEGIELAEEFSHKYYFSSEDGATSEVKDGRVLTDGDWDDKTPPQNDTVYFAPDNNSEGLDCQTYISSDTSEAFHRKQAANDAANPDALARQILGSATISSTSFSQHTPIVAQDSKSNAPVSLLAVSSVGFGISQTPDSEPSDVILPRLHHPFRKEPTNLERNASGDKQHLEREQPRRSNNKEHDALQDIANQEMSSKAIEEMQPSNNSCSSNFFQQMGAEPFNDVLVADDAFFGAEDFPFDCAPMLLADAKKTTSQSRHRSRLPGKEVGHQKQSEHSPIPNSNDRDLRNPSRKDITSVPSLMPTNDMSVGVLKSHQPSNLGPVEEHVAEQIAVQFQSSISAFTKPSNVVGVDLIDDEDIFSGLEDEVNSLAESSLSGMNEFSPRQDENQSFHPQNASSPEMPYISTAENANMRTGLLHYEPPPPPPPHSWPPSNILEPSAVVNTVNSDITSSLLAGDFTKEQPEWIPLEGRHTIHEDPCEEEGDDALMVNQSSLDSKSKSRNDNESVPFSADPNSFHSGSTRQAKTCTPKPIDPNSFKATAIPGASKFLRMGWDFFDSFTTNLCRVPGSTSYGTTDFATAPYQNQRTSTNPVSGATSDSSTVATMQTNNGSYTTASQLSLSLQERRVWDEWDRRDSVNALNKAALRASASINSEERQDRPTERDRARDKLLTYASTAQAAVAGPQVAEQKKSVKSARTRDDSAALKLRSHPMDASIGGSFMTNSTTQTHPVETNDAQTVETSSTFDLKTKSIETPPSQTLMDDVKLQPLDQDKPPDVSPTSCNGMNEGQARLSDAEPTPKLDEKIIPPSDEPENPEVAVTSEKVDNGVMAAQVQKRSFQPKEATRTHQPRRNDAQAVAVLSLRERRILEKFSSRLSSSGLEVLKQNRDRKWQARFVTVSKEVTWLNPEESSHHSGDRFPCPRGLLWLKKFTGKSKDVSLTNIDKHGRGGLAFSQLVSATVSDAKSFGSTLTRRQQFMFGGTAVVCLEYTCRGSTKSVLLCCKSDEDSEFLVTGLTMICSLLKRREEMTKQGTQGTPISVALSANSTIESHSLSVSTSEDSN